MQDEEGIKFASVGAHPPVFDSTVTTTSDIMIANLVMLQRRLSKLSTNFSTTVERTDF